VLARLRGGRGSPVLAFEGVHVTAHPAAGVKAAPDRTAPHPILAPAAVYTTFEHSE